ncbi:GNAT family N-acetyltransferase [Pseudoalteromonas sp. MMG013]|uniref:GNAT family N-acetyltransferase n=1 Tax=Pseudoalteromonas sp. MMG013 TaxID=2822687 RepID=UPI001B3983F9|nr:GNAT family N-acetyltransferase [Pseudoalteromonas sp. MMG013]MBQ4864605.1 GNAT family N-acetyltransferase [Pseudoalteromonas sp. MMG013]
MNLLSNILYRENHGFSYSYFENYADDCNCMWRKYPEPENVYTIERIDILPEFRRKGFARNLLKDAIKRIEAECPKACVMITAEPDDSCGITLENLVSFYESLGFEKHQNLGSRVHLRLYLDDSVKPRTVYDYPLYFK